jgi:tetratricopeptide (TPR) repeat protein
LKGCPVRLIACCAVFVFLVGMAAAGPADSSKVNTLIAEGDAFSEKTFENAKALKKFEEALAAEPSNYDALWRMSRTYVDIGEHLPSKSDEEKQEQLKWYAKSLEFANKAIQANASGSLGYTRRAIASGRIALFKGIWESLDLVKSVKADCEKAIQLDPACAPAYYVLARTHLKVCEKPKMVRWPLGLGWGNMDESMAFFEKAIALRPNFIMYRLDAARAYAEEDEFAKAKEQLMKIATMGKEDEDDDQFKKEAAELMEKIKNE